MIQVADKSQCSGCGSCYAVCPRKCIVMRSDEEGFLYPEPDAAACIGCGKCERACPVLSMENSRKAPEAWACVCKDEKVRQESSSGGIFTLLAERILEQGGIVYGAAFDQNWNVIHVAAERKEELGKLRGSKYVQSRTGDCYEEAGAWLKAGRLVYFSGTSCQIDGLKAYLQRDYDNLYCQDVICHGVPSPRAWQAYLKSLNREGKWKQISFREKSRGWRNFCICFSDGKRKQEQCHKEDPYMKLFLNNVSLRPSCYACHSKGYGRHSDLTLGDFWGADTAVPDMDDDRGISLVLVQSRKGKELFEEISGRMRSRRVDLKDAARGNYCLLHSADHPAEKRRRLFQELRQGGLGESDFGQLAEKLTAKSLWARGKKAVWKALYDRKRRT